MNLSPARQRISTLNNPANVCRTPTNGGKNNPPKISFVYNKDRVIGNKVEGMKTPLKIKTEFDDNVHMAGGKENIGGVISMTPTAKMLQGNQNVFLQRSPSCYTPSKSNVPIVNICATNINQNRAVTSYAPPTVSTPLKNTQNIQQTQSNIHRNYTNQKGFQSVRYVQSINKNNQTQNCQKVPVAIQQQQNSNINIAQIKNTSNINNNNNIRDNSPSSQKRSNLPPLSPKRNSKKLIPQNIQQKSSIKKQQSISSSNNKTIPSFILQKQKQRTQQEDKKSHNIQEQEQQQCRCGNQNPTHSDLRQKQKYCTKCGVQKMLDGVQIKQYVSPHKNKNPSSPALLNPNLLWQERDDDEAQLSFSCPSKNNGEEISSFLSISNADKKSCSSKISIKQPSKQMEIQQFIKEMEEEKDNLEKIQQSLQNSDQNIAKFYRDKKICLKQHYQKIKAAIKLSIQQDLKQLAEMQKQQLEQLKKDKKQLRKDITKISQIIQKDLKGTLLSSQKNIQEDRRLSHGEDRRNSVNIQDYQQQKLIMPSHRRISSNISNTSLIHQNYHEVLRKGKQQISSIKQKYSNSQIFPSSTSSSSSSIPTKTFHKPSSHNHIPSQQSWQLGKKSSTTPSFLKPSIINNNQQQIRSNLSSRRYIQPTINKSRQLLYQANRFRMISNSNRRISQTDESMNNHEDSETMDPIAFNNNRQREQTCRFEGENLGQQEQQDYYQYLRSGNRTVKRNGVLFSFQNRSHQ